MRSLVGGWVLALVASAAVVGGCAQDEAKSSPDVRGDVLSSPRPDSPSPSDILVGEWSRVTTCRQRVEAMRVAGLGKYAAASVAGDGFIPNVTSVDGLADPAHPCRGAVRRKHSHFFTDDGAFGSRDEHGAQVDDGHYRVLSADRVRIGRTVFRFRVSQHRTLRLWPHLPSCASDGCFQAQWAIAVSYLGRPWTRVS